MCVALLILALPALARAHPLDDLEPGHWYEVANSHMRDVAPDPLPPGHFANIMGAWSGGALDSKRERLLVWGGGHGDYSGNEIYAFDIESMTWARIWGPSANIPTDGLCRAAYPDGAASSRHTYDGVEFIPSPVDAMWANGGSLWCGSGGGSTDTWLFHFGTDKWARQSGGPERMDVTVISGFDPVTGHIFMANTHHIAEFDPINGVWTDRYENSAGWWESSDATGAIDPTRRLMVFVGNTRFGVFHLDNHTYHAPAPQGASAIVDGRPPGLAYDPVADRIVGWNGGPEVYTLDLDDLTWAVHPPAATNTTTPTDPAERGTYGRFRYLPARNAYVLVNGVDDNVFFYKLSPGVE